MPPNPLQCEFREDSLETPQKPQIAFRKSTNTHHVSSVISVSHKLVQRQGPPTQPSLTPGESEPGWKQELCCRGSAWPTGEPGEGFYTVVVAQERNGEALQASCPSISPRIPAPFFHISYPHSRHRPNHDCKAGWDAEVLLADLVEELHCCWGWRLLFPGCAAGGTHPALVRLQARCGEVAW